MFNTILNMYITTFPIILSGILNMIFTKTSIYKNLKKPIDCGKKMKDGKRILGDNKTWIGFISMSIICMFCQSIWGFVCYYLNIVNRNELYIYYENNFIFNLIVGFCFGFIYMLCELPNSFIKRRLDIKPGKTVNGLKGIFFFVFDQIDSLIGVFLLLSFLSSLTFNEYLSYILLGGITHITINLILYKLKIRRNL